MTGMKNEKAYTSISCSAYDVLESSAVLRHDLELHLYDGPSVRGRILDVFARGKEEFCSIKTADASSPVEIRLDKIMRISDHTTNKEYATNVC